MRGFISWIEDGDKVWFLTPDDVKGTNPDDYKIKAGHCKQDYECGIVCFSGITSFNEDNGPEYIVTNTIENRIKGYSFYTDTQEIIMDGCVFRVLQVTEESIEYKARARQKQDSVQTPFIYIPQGPVYIPVEVL